MAVANIEEDKTRDQLIYRLFPLVDNPITDSPRILRNTASTGTPCGAQVKHRSLRWGYGSMMTVSNIEEDKTCDRLAYHLIPVEGNPPAN